MAVRVSLANIDVAAIFLRKARCSPLTTLSILITFILASILQRSVPKLYVDSYIYIITHSRIFEIARIPRARLYYPNVASMCGCRQYCISCICIAHYILAPLLPKRFFVLLEGGAITDDISKVLRQVASAPFGAQAAAIAMSDYDLRVTFKKVEEEKREYANIPFQIFPIIPFASFFGEFGNLC
jgi:hypothetical protein